MRRYIHTCTYYKYKYTFTKINQSTINSIKLFHFISLFHIILMHTCTINNTSIHVLNKINQSIAVYSSYRKSVSLHTIHSQILFYLPVVFLKIVGSSTGLRSAQSISANHYRAACEHHGTSNSICRAQHSSSCLCLESSRKVFSNDKDC